MDTCKSNLNKSSSISRKSHFVSFIMESAFVRYLLTRLFSQNSCVNIVRQHKRSLCLVVGYCSCHTPQSSYFFANVKMRTGKLPLNINPSADNNAPGYGPSTCKHNIISDHNDPFQTSYKIV